MRKGGYKLIFPVVVCALIFAFGAVLYAGCGSTGADSYISAVLDGWSRLESNSEELVEAAQEIGDEADLEDYYELLTESEDYVDSFADDLRDVDIPTDMAESNEALDDFLAAYEEYLGAISKNLDAVIAGEELDYTPDLDTPAVEAEEALEDYQDSQDYNEADLDRDIWDLPGLLGEAIVAVYGGDYGNGEYAKVLEAVDAWYYYFNLGDGDSMWYMIDPGSPLLDTFSNEQFLVFVGEANGGGLQAYYSVDDVEVTTDAEGDWATVYLTVDYSDSVGMEDEIIPGGTEEVIIDLVNREDGWFIYNVFSTSSIW